MVRPFLAVVIFVGAAGCSSEAPGQAGGTDAAERDARARADVATGDNRVIGTIEASIDGRERTWYVLEGQVEGERESSAFWYEPEPGAPRAMIAGYDTRDVSFENLGDANRPLGDYDGSGITLVITFQPGEDTRSVRLPAEHETNVLYMPVMAGGDGSSLFQFVDGQLDFMALRAPRSGTGEVRGTFSGTMRDLLGTDQSMTVTDGRFEVEELTYREELPGSGGYR